MVGTSGAKHQTLDETALLADGRVAVIGIGDSVSREAVSQAAAKWSSGYPGLRRALERSTWQHLPPKLHKFFRTAGDSLVFVCHVDSEGDAKCHVLAASPDDAFGIAGVGHNYWVYKAGLVSRDAFLDATTGGWLMAELPWTVPGLSDGAPPLDSTAGALVATPDQKQYESVELCPGLWCTCNGSVVAVSRIGAVSWGATVARGGHQFGELPGVSPGSMYRLAATGAVIWPESDVSALPSALRELVALSGMALAHRLDVLDFDGALVEVLDPLPP